MGFVVFLKGLFILCVFCWQTGGFQRNDSFISYVFYYGQNEHSALILIHYIARWWTNLVVWISVLPRLPFLSFRPSKAQPKMGRTPCYWPFQGSYSQEARLGLGKRWIKIVLNLNKRKAEQISDITGWKQYSLKVFP